MHTSWLTPNQLYEDALKTFVERVLDSSPGNRFIPALAPFLRKAAAIGMVSSLSQVVVKLGSPGVPDFYQGTELWDLNLVDPDNRRPVDFDRRRTLLDEVDHVLALGADQRPARLAAYARALDGRADQAAHHRRRTPPETARPRAVPVRRLRAARNRADGRRQRDRVRTDPRGSRDAVRRAAPVRAAVRAGSEADRSARRGRPRAYSCPKNWPAGRSVTSSPAPTSGPPAPRIRAGSSWDRSSSTCRSASFGRSNRFAGLRGFAVRGFAGSRPARVALAEAGSTRSP